MSVEKFAGRLFRSRVEVAWAMLFEVCDIDYTYEPFKLKIEDEFETFHYVPDFYIPEQYMVLEIKFGNSNDHDYKKWKGTEDLLRGTNDAFQVLNGPPWLANTLFLSGERRLDFPEDIVYELRMEHHQYKWPKISFKEEAEIDIRQSNLKVVSKENIHNPRGSQELQD